MTRPHEPTAETQAQVGALVAFGQTQEAIGAFLSISAPTLRKHYRAEIARGAVAANLAVGQSLFDQAVGGNVVACIFWCKTRMGWKERPVQVETLPAPAAPSFDADMRAEMVEMLTAMTQAERDELEAILRRRVERDREAIREESEAAAVLERYRRRRRLEIVAAEDIG